MAKGGYQVISFATFGGAEGEKIPGAYKKAASGKAILIEDLDPGDGARTSGFGIAHGNAVAGIDIELTVGMTLITINVTEDDTVTVTGTAYAEAGD